MQTDIIVLVDEVVEETRVEVKDLQELYSLHQTRRKAMQSEKLGDFEDITGLGNDIVEEA